jgi:methionyl-tRNA formyltransferase
MRVLFLGPSDSRILAHLRLVEDVVAVREDPITAEDIEAIRPDWVVSHGYRHVIRPAVLNALPDRFINAHISLLPWNRGMHPNVWSWVEDTPKGVTLHLIDPGLDTGDIIAQREVELGDDHTLATSYAVLQEAMLDLFREWWPVVRTGDFPRTPQVGEGTFHLGRQLDELADLMPLGWDTPVTMLEGKRRHR